MINMLNEKYTEENMLENSIAFLKELIFNPNVDNGAFNQKSFDLMKQALKEEIESFKDNPKTYSKKRLYQETAPDTIISYNYRGNLEDLEEITPESLYDYYKSVIENDILDIFIIGEVEEEQIKTIISNAIPNFEREAVSEKHYLDYLPPKVGNAVTIGSVVAGIVALIIVAAIVTSFVFSMVNSNKIKLQNTVTGSDVETTIDPKKTEVPNVVGMSEDEAEKTLHEKELGVKYEAYEYNDQYQSGYIIKQSVAKGKVIDKNETILLTVSKGAEKIEVPSGIKGSDLDTAISKLEDKDLKWELVYEYSSSEINRVISCYPIEQALVSKGDTIKLTVSRGQKTVENSNVGTIPNVEGKKLDKAQQLISNAGYSVGDTKEVYDEEIEKGIVIRQTIKSGYAPKGTTISLVVSKGSKDADKKYKGTYTFAKEDLMDEEGNPITSGTVVVLLNGSSQGIDPEYSDVSKWPGDYTMTLTSDTKGKATIELLIDGKVVKTDKVKLK